MIPDACIALGVGDGLAKPLWVQNFDVVIQKRDVLGAPAARIVDGRVCAMGPADIGKDPQDVSVREVVANVFPELSDEPLSASINW